MQSFRDVLDLCGFVDLGYSGPEFTWHGRRKGELIWEQLDWGVANYEGWQGFLQVELNICIVLLLIIVQFSFL